jgi:nicotinamide riboside transporter PnuC
MWLGYFFVLVVKMEMMKLWFNITIQIYDIQFSNRISNIIGLVLVVLIFKRRFGLWGVVLLPGMFVRKA